MSVEARERAATDRVATGTVVFRDGAGKLHVTVVVKATYSLRPGGLASLAPPLPLSGDVARGEVEGASLYAASDFAPAKACADVVIVGRVHPESAGAVRQVVGFALARGPDVLLSKRLVAMGDRSRFDADPAPIGDLPLAWERTWGGPSSRDNPVGSGLSADGARPPNLIDPEAPRRPAGLGPIAPSWAGRAAFLTREHAAALRANPLVLPDDLDLRFFQVAPADQQTPRLLGGEQVLLIGILPGGASAICRLPALHAFARLEGPMRGRALVHDVALAGDTLWIDAERGVACVTYRGSVEVASAREAPRVLDAREPWIVRAGMAPCKDVEESLGAPRAWSLPREIPPEPGEVPLLPNPTVDPVTIEDTSGFTTGSLTWSFEPPKLRRVVIVKGSFVLSSSGGRPALAPEQDALRGDEPAGDPGGEIVYPSDLAPFKAKTDVLLRGTAHALPGRTTAVVELSVGPVSARLVAIGPRRWDKNGIPEVPGAFVPVPLRWKNAFGGPGFHANPAGTGLAPGTPPPLLEDPERLMRARGERPRPSCFGPIAPGWQARSALLGTFDKAWQRDRWPHFPANFDPAFFQAAPASLRCDYLRGDETFHIESVRPGGGGFDGVLPGVRPRAFAVRREGDAFEVLLRLDTVLFDTDAGRVHLTWRGSFDVPRGAAEAAEIERLLVIRESLEAPRSIADVLALIAAIGERRLGTEHVGSDDVRVSGAAVSSAAAATPSFRLGDRLRAMAAMEKRAALGVGGAVTAGLFAARAGGVVASPPSPPKPLGREQVEALVREGKGLAGRDLSGADLRGVDLSKQRLEGAILARAKLAGARFEGASLAGANLADIDAPGSMWDGADLARADLTRAGLAGASFVNAVLERATLAGADLTEARMEGARAVGADLSGAKLTKCRAEGANLAKADLTGARLASASLKRACLDDAKLDEVVGPSVELDEASLKDARFEKARLAGGLFRGVAAVGASWECADLSGAVIGGDVSGAIFAGARLGRADLRGVLARGTSFRGADLVQAKLDGADLMQASFEGADLRAASFVGASLFQAETYLANLEGADLSNAFLAGTKVGG